MKYFTEDDEQTLLVRLKSGDRDSLSRLYYLYSDQLRYYLQRAAKSPLLAEDVVHDTFLKIWKYRDQLDPSVPFRPYLFVIAKRTLFSLLRRARHEAEILSEIKKSYVEADQSTQLLLDYNESSKLIDEAVGRLSGQVKRTFIFCRVQGLSYRQAAAALNITESTVNKHMSRALQLIREHIRTHTEKISLLFCISYWMFFCCR